MEEYSNMAKININKLRKMDLSISIVNYNTKNLIKQCIKNIVNSNIPLKYEIIIIDNNSKDDSVKFIKKEIIPNFKNIKLISLKSNKGFGGGHNIGLKNSKANYVMVTNPDVIVLDDSIYKLYKFIKENQNIGIVGPKLLYPDLSLQRSFHRWPKILTPIYKRTPLGKTIFGKKEIKRYEMLDVDHSKPQKVNWLFGACLIIRKTVWDKLKGFDDSFFLYYEDIDLCRRCWDIGFEVWYFPNAKMIHYHKRMSAKKKWWAGISDKNTRIHIKSHFKYFNKYK